MSSDISDSVKKTLNRYFRDLDGERPHALYDMVLNAAEKPLLEVVMKQANGNQTMAADMLGINRNTLRRKLADHDLL
jgi:Fis family transcriptional regulator